MAVQAKGGKEARARPKRAPGSRLTQAEIDEIFRRFQKADPHPKTELHYRDPFTLLVAVVLSAQATDASVNRATPELFRIADTPEKLAAARRGRRSRRRSRPSAFIAARRGT